ncbi:LOW QUALITY PROTEIN: hypothetical protein PAHAL_8G109500 [Panicum hallii]|uniref:Dirigent protein n=1 Tax=Panicum hallii TaxID=206008 RepID=A0A2T8I8G4_9POAL|nr:LOW QUALITY PROTEIN: hypothetical protein PAHAL_8G109500 [Panicum hallii]
MSSLPPLFLGAAFFLLAAAAVHLRSFGADDGNNGSREAAAATAHLHFYIHYEYTSPRPSALRVVSGRRRSMLLPPSPPSSDDGGGGVAVAAQFGDIVVLNNALTEGPWASSARVSAAQGFGVRLSEGGVVSHVTLHLVLEAGEHRGSSVTVSCRIDVDAKVRESVVLGGTGKFRFARGYMLTSNYDYDLARGGVVEFDVHLLLQS